MINERRKHKRFPVMKNLIKPIELIFDTTSNKLHVPAVLLDLSAGGIGLLTFVPIETGTKIITYLIFEGLNTGPIEGKVVWVITKGESWRVGIAFTKIEKTDFDKINSIAQDYIDCETQISMKIKNICYNSCKYWPLCNKPIKLDIKNKNE
jgi:hypothetical protein